MRYTIVSLAEPAGAEATDDLAHLVELGQRRARSGWVLRTLADSAAEQAVEQGCDLEGGGKEQLHAPLAEPGLATPPEQAFAHAEALTADWLHLDGPTRQKLAAAVCRLLGPSLRAPIDLLLLHGGGRARPPAELKLIRKLCAHEAIPVEFCPPAPARLANWRALAEIPARWSVGEVPQAVGVR